MTNTDDSKKSTDRTQDPEGRELGLTTDATGMGKLEYYTATLIGLDGFSKVMSIREPVPYLFVPIKKTINAYLDTQPIYDSPTIDKRTFEIDRKHSYKKQLTYREKQI